MWNLPYYIYTWKQQILGLGLWSKISQRIDDSTPNNNSMGHTFGEVQV